MARSNEEIFGYVREIRLRAYSRDQRMGNVRAARAGEVSHIMPGMLPDTWPKPIIANTIDLAARFSAEQTGVMPTISCSSGVSVSARQKKYAEKRTLIAHHYADQSKLRTHLIEAADWYDTYGFVPLIVEPHFGGGGQEAGPRLRFENPLGCYYDLNAYGATKCYIKVYEEDVASLVAKFPHLRAAILRDASDISRSIKIEMVTYMDEDQTLVFLPTRQDAVIYSMANPLGYLPVYIASRTTFDPQTRGSYDDVVWIQLARAKFAMLGLAAAEKSVNAPLAIPSDVQKVTLGPDAVLRTNNPQAVKRVALEMSPAAFQVGEMLNTEAMTGARFPEGATGKSPGSVVTGEGMDRLMGTIDTKIRTAQEFLGDAMRMGLVAAFHMDQKFWPRLERKVRVNVRGTTYEETYVPLKDIAGIYQVDVTYGMAAGMDPNKALVFLLQLRGDKAISRWFMLENMPFDVNVDQEMERIDTEEMDDALKQGLFSLAGALGAFVQQGQDPTKVIKQLADVSKYREKGMPLRDAVIKAFTPPTPPPGSEPPGAAPDQGAGQPGTPGLPGQPGPPAGPGMQAPGGGGPPTAPGQQGMGPGGKPDLMSMLAGLSGGGQPQLGAAVQRKQPAG